MLGRTCQDVQRKMDCVSRRASRLSNYGSIMRKRTYIGNWIIAFAVTAIIVVVCIVYVDRPAAEFFDTHLRHTAAWVWITRTLAPLDLTVAIALLFVFGCVIWASSGRLLPLWTRTPLLCSWAAIVGNCGHLDLQTHLWPRLARSGICSEPPSTDSVFCMAVRTGIPSPRERR